MYCCQNSNKKHVERMVYGVCQCFLRSFTQNCILGDIMILRRMWQECPSVSNFVDFTDWNLSSCDSQMLPCNTYAMCVTHRISLHLSIVIYKYQIYLFMPVRFIQNQLYHSRNGTCMVSRLTRLSTYSLLANHLDVSFLHCVFYEMFMQMR